MSATINGCWPRRRDLAATGLRSSALWNGQGGDGPGGAQHLMEEAGRKTSRIYWLDTRKLWD